jgi:hypothetical protein
VKQKPKKKTVLRGRSAGIMVEDFDHKLDLIIEKVERSESSLRQEIKEFREEVKEEFDGVRIVLKHQQETLQKHEETLQRHDEDISLLKQAAFKN